LTLTIRRAEARAAADMFRLIVALAVYERGSVTVAAE
jgi:hypothetical protein